MHYIKVLATDSTNTELRRRLSRNPRMSNTSLYALHQEKGRGQRGTPWLSHKHSNLTFSLLLNNLTLPATEYFKLNAAISISICRFLERRIIDIDFYIKWPNDILAENHKICGILIENLLAGNHIKSSIIGIGLNANQTDFKDLPKASSLKLLTHEHFDLEQLWRDLTESINNELDELIALPIEDLLKLYAQSLYKKDINAKFEFPDGTVKNGIIKGVSSLGRLQIQFFDQIEEFQLKEIRLLY